MVAKLALARSHPCTILCKLMLFFFIFVFTSLMSFANIFYNASAVHIRVWCELYVWCVWPLGLYHNNCHMSPSLFTLSKRCSVYYTNGSHDLLVRECSFIFMFYYCSLSHFTLLTLSPFLSLFLSIYLSLSHTRIHYFILFHIFFFNYEKEQRKFLIIIAQYRVESSACQCGFSITLITYIKLQIKIPFAK